MASKKILIQVILDDKASASNKKLSSSLGKTTGEFKKMTAEQEKQYITQQKNIISNKLYTDSLKQQALSQVDVAEATGNARAQSGLNNAILLETGRLASDASYGFTAMANNLGQIVSLFGSFIKTNDGVVASFKQLIGSLWGTGGLLIGIQLLISFGPKIVQFFNELIGRSTLLAETFEDVSSHLGETTGRFELYIKTLQDSTKSEQEKLDAISALNKEFPEYIDRLEKAGVSIEDVKNKTQSSLDVNKAQREEIKKLAMSKAAQAAIEEEAGKLIQLSIDEEIEKRNLLNEIKKEEERIKNKQLKIDEFNAKEKQGKLYADARIERGILEGEIKAIEGDIKRKKENYDIEVANLVEKNNKEKAKIDEKINDLLEFTDIETEIVERKTVKTQELFKKGLETNELYLQGYTGQQIMAMEALDEGLEERNKKFDDLDKKNQERQKLITQAEKTEAQARIKIREGYFDAAKSVTQGLKALGDLDDGFKIAAIITEKAEAIARVVIKTKETNQVISAAGKVKTMLGDLTAEAKARKRIISNKISAGINIAGIVAAAAGGINAIKSKSAMTATAGGAEGGEAGEVQAPDFNVVGQGAGSQLVSAVQGQLGGALRAYVVSGDISSAQELDRKINTTATIG